jgi:RNA polymerase sigma-70 factor, ECF subfamily
MTSEGQKPEKELSWQDENGFRQIVADHSRILYAHIRSMVLDHDDANDVLQNTFIKAWQNLNGFRNQSKIGTWLFRIATNEALQHLRKQRVRKLFLISSKSYDGQQSPEFGSNNAEAIKRKLEKAMHNLSVQQRMVFGMRYYNDMKYTEMAEILELSQGTLKAVYHNAVKKIEKYLIANV